MSLAPINSGGGPGTPAIPIIGGSWPTGNRSAGWSTSSGQSTSSGGNAGVAVNMQSPQSEWALQLADIERQLGQNTYDWANNQYGNTSALTDQAIGNYLGNSAAGQGMATQAINQYNQQGVPQINNLFREANTYASPAFRAQQMGQAESDSAQASEAARKSAESQLQSFGADPTSGRYAGLDEAQKMQAAAAAAGAGQTMGNQVIQQGQNLRGQAVAAAEQLPGEAANALNESYSGLSGAENAGLSNVNTGANAMNTANNFMNTAMNLKYPNVGQNTTASNVSQSTNQSASAQSGASGGMGGGGTSSGGGLSDSPSSGQFGTSQPGSGGGGGGGGGYYGGYRTGGAIGDEWMAAGGDTPTTGGPVPSSASPSQGAITDDIPARLNAHEFVIPQDVALWKGQEHFHKLINQSRQARQQVMAQKGAAKPSLGPPAAGPPRFVSTHMMGGAI